MKRAVEQLDGRNRGVLTIIHRSTLADTIGSHGSGHEVRRLTTERPKALRR